MVMLDDVTNHGEERLTRYLEGVGDILGNSARRASFATYTMGLLSDAERKSVEPIAARASPDVAAVDAVHQQLLHFVGVSNWSDTKVRLFAAQYALAEMTRHEEVEVWIIDDTGMLKQGTHSVGVQRQYTGSAGKITNCQVAVGLTVATAGSHLPIDFALYLPRKWTDDEARRKEAKIPDSTRFCTKTQLAVDMIKAAVSHRIPTGVVLADSAYGDSASFRKSIRDLNLHFGVAVSSGVKIWRVDKDGFMRGNKISVSEMGHAKSRPKFGRVTWRDGTKGRMSARFDARRVVPCASDGTPKLKREAVWLLVEWEDGKEKPSKYHLCSLPEATPLKQMVRLLKQRWRTERVFQELKGELGFDHYEGRRHRGWHHHVSAVLAAYAFIASERTLAFPPSGWSRSHAHSDGFEA